MKKLREMFPNGFYTDNSEGVFERFKELLENDYRDSDESNYDGFNYCGLDPYYELDLVQYNYTSSYEEISVYLTNKEFFNITLDDKLTIGDTPEQFKECVKAEESYIPKIGELCEASHSCLRNGEWTTVEPLKNSERDQYLWACHILDGYTMDRGYDLVWLNKFRPILTEREMFIQQGIDDLSGLNHYEGLDEVLGKLFDKGYTKGETK